MRGRQEAPWQPVSSSTQPCQALQLSGLDECNTRRPETVVEYRSAAGGRGPSTEARAVGWEAGPGQIMRGHFERQSCSEHCHVLTAPSDTPRMTAETTTSWRSSACRGLPSSITNSGRTSAWRSRRPGTQSRHGVAGHAATLHVTMRVSVPRNGQLPRLPSAPITGGTIVLSHASGAGPPESKATRWTGGRRHRAPRRGCRHQGRLGGRRGFPGYYCVEPCPGTTYLETLFGGAGERRVRGASAGRKKALAASRRDNDGTAQRWAG